MEEERLFHRIWSFCYGKTMAIISLFINIKVLNNMSFEHFLNSFKHEMIHKWIPTTPCCLCPDRANLSFHGRSVLSKPQIATLYDINVLEIPGHQPTHPVTGAIKQYCVCNISALHGVETDAMDIGTVHCILKTCASSIFMRVQTHIEVVRTIRNYLAHSTNHKITNLDFNTKWEELEKAVLFIAAEISPSHKLYEAKQIANLKDTDITSDGDSKKLWEHLSTKIRKEEQNQQNILDELRDIRIDVKKLTFIITCHHFHEKQNQHVQSRGWKCCMCFSTRGNRPMFLEMKIDTPESWDVKVMQELLLRKSSQISGLDIDSVSIGSLIIVFKAARHIVEDYEQFKPRAELFFTTMVNVCKIDVDTTAVIEVNSTVIVKPDDKHSVPSGSVGVVNNKPIHTESIDISFKGPDDEMTYERKNRHDNDSMRTDIEKFDKKLTQRQWWRSSTRNARYGYCAAIDIGSSYSGYAFSAYDDYTKEPTKMYTNIWFGTNLLTLKAPTAVLLDPDQEFVAFGYEAENTYSELVGNGEHEDYYYFHSFKMLLYKRRITRDIKIKDELDKEMDAIKVFQSVIQFLKDHLFKSISDKIKGIQENALHYVLTVPAIWEDSAKQFMREAATMAGIKSGQLSIALEPEAASIYCKHLKTDKQGDAKEKNAFAQTIKAGMKYMVVDLGGGSADITVHQRNRDGSVREVIPPSGGPWGGKSIDEAFHNFLKRIYGPKVMEELRKTELEDFIDLFREFETKKKSIRINQTNKVVLTLPVALIDLVKSQRGKMETALEESIYRDSVYYSKQKMHIVPDTFRDLFKPTIKDLVEHLDALLRQAELRDLKTIVMVGGFSECELVQHRVMERFGRNITIIIPEEAGLAVLKGAVLYGHSA